MQNIMINNTNGKNDVAKATVPFIVGCASTSHGRNTAMFLTHDAIFLATKGGADGLQAEGFTPVKELIDAYVEGGGAIWVCAACAKAKGLGNDDLIEGAEIAGAGLALDFLDKDGQVFM